MGLDVPMFGMDPDVVEAIGAEATGAEAASKVIDEVIVAKAAAGSEPATGMAPQAAPGTGCCQGVMADGNEAASYGDCCISGLTTGTGDCGAPPHQSASGA